MKTINVLTIDCETDDWGGYDRKKVKVHPHNPNNKIICYGQKHNDTETKVVYCHEGVERIIYADLGFTNVIVGHNIKYDLSYYYNQDPELKKWSLEGLEIWDTQIAEYIMSGQEWIYPSLDDCCLKYGLPLKDVEVKEAFKDKMSSEIPHEQLIAYNKMDVDNTYAIYLKQMEILEKNPKLLKVIKSYMRHLCPLLEMENNGAYVNTDVIDKYEAELTNKLESLRNELDALVKPHWPEHLEFNPASPQQLATLLFGGDIVGEHLKPILDEDGNEQYYGKTAQKAGQVKYKKYKYTLSVVGLKLSPLEGSRSTDEAVLNHYIKEPICAKLLEIRSISKTLNTYCLAIKYGRNPNTGCIHTIFNTTATETGRLSSKNPNLQNIDKTFLEWSTSRFGDMGVIVESDYNQLEVRILAFLSQEPILIHEVNSGVDLHSAMAREIFNVEEVTKEQRAVGKTFNFRFAYGAGAKLIAEAAGITEDQAKNAIYKYYLKYPKVEEFHKSILDRVERNKYRTDKVHKESRQPLMASKLRMFHGKQYYFLQQHPIWAQEKGRDPCFTPTQPKNFPMQGTAADMVIIAAYEVWKWLGENPDIRCYMWNEVHDALYFDCHIDDVEMVKHGVKTIMENIDKLFGDYYNVEVNVKFPVDIKTGKSWQECKNG